MYINNEDFEIWMQKLSKKLSENGQDLKSIIKTKEVFDPKFYHLNIDIVYFFSELVYFFIAKF